ncbi:hypothetical protein DSM106972_020030 [Dulcicalothrix desertica PCC 7102]|uniref:Uncharacterized protein n=1 Tax=Dulcicalothrix desertica PCC 7102 TaxID=232991 RepID=A0A433VNM3_9CYAN|nr:hypothetical protein DSM106972_020030 [Dulcicalothrix desertica PCC 7102]TWH39276.1 hypothetical protein CAL7102_08495 [Dulcicalothrix desertica PCC 7102]
MTRSDQPVGPTIEQIKAFYDLCVRMRANNTMTDLNYKQLTEAQLRDYVKRHPRSGRSFSILPYNC